eukprot:TRINITY_DN5267_c0_g1_i2.p1 TRINITY_DN5267_c0_g1~~TRINITY_DN5267_c0_g1_i2.p1  ORF type:complete len:584 (+),score=92.46 TRINITY_DN5267_c0_g1_i2:72-1823(+)
MSCTPIVCQSIAGATKEQIFANHDGMQSVLAHLISIRSYLENLTTSHQELQEAMADLQAISGGPLPNLSRTRSKDEEKLKEMGAGATGAFSPEAVQEAEKAPLKDLEVDPELRMAEELGEEIEDIAAQPGHSTVHDIEVEEQDVELKERDLRHASYIQRLKTMTLDQWESLVDVVVAIGILSNAIVIGLSIDEPGTKGESGGWAALDVCYSVAFLIELIWKFVMLGFKKYFSSTSNIIDFILVTMDVVQLVVSQVFGADFSSHAFSVLRIIRLARVGRIVRVLRLNFSADLVKMISGVSGSVTTLSWSFLLTLVAIYVFALIMRETLGREPDDEDTAEYFNSVPRSIYTLYRCSLGDCSTAGGTPIFEHVTNKHSVFYTLFYCMFEYFVMVGLMNVISAIFVESTMSVALETERMMKAERSADKALWATRIAIILRVIMKFLDPLADINHLSDEVLSIHAMEVTGEQFSEILKDTRVMEALDDLDIDPQDHPKLPDILDPDNSGVLGVVEIVEGIARLRGDPRRSDIVAIDLMVRSIQSVLNTAVRDVEEVKDALNTQTGLLSHFIQMEIEHNKKTLVNKPGL